MLTISPINKVEYCLDLADEDYYLSGQEPPGLWLGFGARYLGLNNSVVKKDSYLRIMQGFSTRGEKLVMNAGEETRRCAWDLTVSSPKSVSLAWAAGIVDTQEKIREAEDEAIKKVVEFLEGKAAYTRRGSKGARHEKVEGLLIAQFEHCSNREQEPQRHRHLLCCNAAPRIDGSWGSIDSRYLYRWKMAAGAIFRAELADQLRQIGFLVEPDGDSFSIVGVDKNICDKFSTRSQQIKGELNKRGIRTSSSKIGSRFKLTTRKHKANVDHNELRETWREDLAALGFGDEYVENLKNKEPQLDKGGDLITEVLDNLTEKYALFSEQDLYRETAILATKYQMSATSVFREVERIIESDDVLSVKSNDFREKLFTTEQVILTEKLMIESAKSLSSRSCKKISGEQIDQSINVVQRELGFSFDKEQVDAIVHSLAAGDLSITQGSAGAGKTTIMSVVKHAYESEGFRIEGAAVAKRAADNLYEETGIKARTVASIIAEVDKQLDPLCNLDVLVVDEAGQLPVSDLQKLLGEAERSSCKIILTGEDKQLDAISRGGALRYLSRPDIIGNQRVESIRRQRQAWARNVVQNLRDGNASEALAVLESKNCVHWSKSSSKAKAQLISDWYDYQKSHPEKESIVLAQRWSDVKGLSETIRELHIKDGRVETQNIPLKCSVADKLFEYRFSVGDRIKFCRNDYKYLKVSNGMLGTIKEINQVEGDVQLKVRLDDQREISFLASEYSDDLGSNICLAYALTVYSAQGVTINGSTFTLYSAGMDRANTYVALSRHKDQSHVYINAAEIDEFVKESESRSQEDRVKVLSSLISKDNYKTLAIESLQMEDKAIISSCLGLDL